MLENARVTVIGGAGLFMLARLSSVWLVMMRLEDDELAEFDSKNEDGRFLVFKVM